MALAAVATMFLALYATSGCTGGLGNARELDARGDLEGAIGAYESVLQRDPENLEALTGTATDLLLLQRYDEALAFQERIVALDPTDAQTRVELGFNYLNHQGRPLDAVWVFGQAATIEPTAQHLSFLAQAERESGDLIGAEATLRRGLEVDPSYERTYDLLLPLLNAAGRTQEVEVLREYASTHGVSIDAAP